MLACPPESAACSSFACLRWLLLAAVARCCRLLAADDAPPRVIGFERCYTRAAATTWPPASSCWAS